MTTGEHGCIETHAFQEKVEIERENAAKELPKRMSLSQI